MRVAIKETKVFKFDELDEKTKQKAMEGLYDINTDFEWWDYLYEDAENIGLEINSFDTYRREIGGKLLTNPANVCEAILKEHGEAIDTYKLASEYLPKLTANLENEDKFEELTEDFERALLQEYLSMLSKEYDYLTSREAIIETIEANDYEFTEEGKIYG